MSVLLSELVLMLALAAAQHHFYDNYAYTKVMGECLGERVYKDYLQQVWAARRACEGVAAAHSRVTPTSSLLSPLTTSTHNGQPGGIFRQQPEALFQHPGVNSQIPVFHSQRPRVDSQQSGQQSHHLGVDSQHFGISSRQPEVHFPKTGILSQQPGVFSQHSGLFSQEPGIFSHQPADFSPQTGVFVRQPAVSSPQQPRFTFRQPGLFTQHTGDFSQQRDVSSHQRGVFSQQPGVFSQSEVAETIPYRGSSSSSSSSSRGRHHDTRFPALRQRRAVGVGRSEVQQAVEKADTLVSEVTCILGTLGVVDRQLEVDFEGLAANTQKLPLPQPLKNDLLTNIHQCRDMTLCLPVQQLGSQLSQKLERLTAFVKCEKASRLSACLKHDLRKNLHQGDLSLLSTDGGAASDQLEGLISLLVVAETASELELI
nr:uncharacterized protein LOC128684085 [Cherax quadricarinatus]